MPRPKFKPSIAEKRPFLEKVQEAISQVSVPHDLPPEQQQALLKLRSQVETYAESLIFTNSRKD